MNPKLLARIGYVLLFVLGIVLCLKSVREPDLWWMYRTGEWMFGNGVTYSDPFSYTQEGVDWINVKWLFELIIVAFKALGGPEMVFVLQAIVCGLILFFIGKTTQLLSQKIYPQADKPWLAMTIAGLLALVSIDFRMIGRPEMSSHLLTAIYLYLFVYNYQKPNSRWIYALIPLQVLWTNLHEAFGIGVVLILAFLAMNWIEYYIRSNWLKAKNIAMPKLLSIASIAALLAIVINPRGPQMWAHPFNIFGQLKDNKFTTELLSYQDALYWQKEAYLNLIFFAFALIIVLMTGFFRYPRGKAAAKIEQQVKTPQALESSEHPHPLFQRYGLPYLLLGAMLFYLSLTAYRNIPFFIIAATPLMGIALKLGINYLQKRMQAMQLVLPFLGIALVLGTYIWVISGSYHKTMASRDSYGLQVLSSHNPVGAADFILENKISGRCFSDYLSSAYLLWRLQPEFKTYIDLRDLDIFPEEFFNEYQLIAQKTELFEQKDAQYNFNYVVLLRRNIEQIPMLYAYLQESPNYELVFVDAVAAVYLKKNEQNKALIEQLGIRKQKDVFHKLPKSKSSALPYFIAKLFNPLFQNQQYDAVDEDAIAAHFYYATGILDLALSYAEKSISKGISKHRGHEIKGLVNARLFLDESTPKAEKEQYGKAGVSSFKQALQAKENSLESLFGLGVLLMEQGQYSQAAQYLQSAKELAPQHPMIPQYLNTCYQKMQGQQ